MAFTDADVGLGGVPSAGSFSDADVGLGAPATRPDSGQRTMLGLRRPQELSADPGLLGSLAGVFSPPTREQLNQQPRQAPERPQSYLDTWQQFHDEAEARMRHGYEALSPKPHQTIGQSLYRPFEVAGGLYDIGQGAIQRTIAPATAAFRNYASVPVEQATGLPAENFESALQTVGPGNEEKISPLSVFDRPRPPPTLEELARRTDPSRGNPASLPGTLQRPPVIDMGEFGRSLEAPPESAASSAEAPTDGGRTPPRLLNPAVPHTGRGSVGAAATGADPLADYTPQQIEAGRKILAESGLDNPNMLDQRLDEISAHHTLGELTPGTEEHLGGIYAADQGQAKNTIAQTLNPRAREAPQRMAALFDRTIGPAENPAQWRREIEADRARQSEPAWQQYAQTTVTPTPALNALMPRLAETGALRAADRAMRIEGLPADGTFGQYGEPGAMPSAVAWQYAKEHLDSLIERALAEPGGANEARRLTQLKNDLVRAIDNHPADDVRGVWQMARRLWQEPSELLDSFKIGQRLLTNNIHRDDLPYITEGWSPQRMQALRSGLRSYLNDQEVASRSDVRTSNRLMDAILGGGNPQKLRFALGEGGAEELLGGIRHEEAMHGAPNRIMYGSPTARRQAARDVYSAAPNQLGQNLSRIAGYIRHPLRQAGAEGVEAASSRATSKAEAEAADLREGLARMFTTQGAERNAVARALVGAEEPGPSAWGPRGGAPGATPVPAGGGPGAGTGPRGGLPPGAPAGTPRGPAGPQPGHVPNVPGHVPSPAPAPAFPSTARPLPSMAELRAAAGNQAAPRVQQMAMHGASDSDIAAATGMPEAEVRSVRERLGIAEGRPAEPPEMAPAREAARSHLEDIRATLARMGGAPAEPAPEMDPARAAARSHLEDIRALLQRMEGHFEGAPAPDDNMADHVIELTTQGHTPHEAHERAAMERVNAGSDDGLPPLPRQARGRIPDAPERAPAHGVEAGAAPRQPGSAVPREALPVSGEVDTEEAQRRNGPDQGQQVERQRSVSRAERLAAQGINEDDIAAIRAAMGAEPSPWRDQPATIPRPQKPVVPRHGRAAQEAETGQQRRISRIEQLAREMKIGEPSEEGGGQPLTRKVIERGRSGRPLVSEPLPYGKENAILEEGLRRNAPVEPASGPLSGRDMHDLLQQGKSYPEIARMAGTTKGVVAGKIARYKANPQQTPSDSKFANKFPRGFWQEGGEGDRTLSDLHAQGHGPKVIAEHFGISHDNVKKMMLERGLYTYARSPGKKGGKTGGYQPTASEWEIGPDGSMSRVLRKRGGRVIGAKTQSEVGLSQNETGVTFRCGTCKYFDRGTCHNKNPELEGRHVKPHWCCNLYDHDGMKVIRTEAAKRASGGRAEGGSADDDLDPSPEDAALSATMTHYPEGPNPAAPYLQDVRNFFGSGSGQGGIYGVLKGRGVDLPQWMDRTADFLHDPAVNAALGMASPLKAERFMWPVKTIYGKTIDMPVSVNPSRFMIQRELSTAPHGDVRALKAPSGDVYMWPANEAMHVDIADNFDLPFKTRQDLQKASYLFNKKDVDALGKFSDFDDLVSKLNAAAE